MAEVATDYLKINLEVLMHCEVRAENEGTMADLHIEIRSFSIKEWRKLIFPCMKFITLNYMKQEIDL
jgi:hypothetical protein